MKKVKRFIKIILKTLFWIWTVLVSLAIIGSITSPNADVPIGDRGLVMISDIISVMLIYVPILLLALNIGLFKKFDYFSKRKLSFKILFMIVSTISITILFTVADNMLHRKYSEEYKVILKQQTEKLAKEEEKKEKKKKKKKQEELGQTVNKDEEAVINNEESDKNNEEVSIEEISDGSDEKTMQKEDSNEKEKNRQKLNMDKYYKAVELSQAIPPKYLEALEVIKTIEENTIAYLRGENLKEEILEAVYIQQCETVSYDYITKMLNSGIKLKVSINVEVSEIQQFGNKTLVTARDTENYNNVYVIVYDGVTELLNGDMAVVFGEVLGSYENEEVGDKILDILQSGYTIMLPQTKYNIPVIHAKILS